MPRSLIAFVLLTVLLALPMPWVPPGVQPFLAMSAAITFIIALFLAAHWVLEKVSPAPYEPFNPRPQSIPPKRAAAPPKRDAAPKKRKAA